MTPDEPARGLRACDLSGGDPDAARAFLTEEPIMVADASSDAVVFIPAGHAMADSEEMREALERAGVRVRVATDDEQRAAIERRLVELEQERIADHAARAAGIDRAEVLKAIAQSLKPPAPPRHGKAALAGLIATAAAYPEFRHVPLLPPAGRRRAHPDKKAKRKRVEKSKRRNRRRR